MTTRTETADLLRLLLDEVRAGRLLAEGQTGSQLVARIEGAIAALESPSPASRKPAPSRQSTGTTSRRRAKSAPRQR